MYVKHQQKQVSLFIEFQSEYHTIQSNKCKVIIVGESGIQEKRSQFRKYNLRIFIEI